MSMEQWVTKTFASNEPARFGYGWISGTLSVFLGALSVFAVLCFRWPEYLVFEEFRGKYPIPLVRAILELAIGLSFLLAFLSAMLRRKKVLAVTGILLALLAVLLGGSEVPLGELSGDSHFYLGLDWFILTLLVLTAVFVPMERLFPYRREQSVFRRGWVTDLQHFFVSHLAVQLLTYLTLLPATVIFAWITGPQLQALVQSQPLWLQFIELMIAADMVEYATHRFFHTSWAWRFHAVHHSVEHMDWIAGSRLHVVDIVVTRGMTFMPIYLLGFAQPAVYAYLLFVSFHAVFLHTNTGFRLGWLENIIAMPRFHHWHHSSEPEAIDKNFALHFPFLDRIFGSFHLPKDRWPKEYGVGGYKLPEGWWAQLWWPFKTAGTTSVEKQPPG